MLHSLGCECDFFLSPTGDLLRGTEEHAKPFELRMRSGDVLVFHGGEGQRVIHSVKGIGDSDTCPEILRDLVPTGRVGLQFRGALEQSESPTQQQEQ